MTQREIFKVFGDLPATMKLNRLVKKICGEPINHGLHRDVYEFLHDKRFVVKVERDPSEGMFANVTEFRNYINHREWTDFSKYLAPCLLINENGRVLLQRRITHKKIEEYPDKIPSLFTDTKYTNFGWIGKQFVCCDYPFLLQGNLKMKKVKWWDDGTHSKLVGCGSGTSLYHSGKFAQLKHVLF